ncbi:preprotein translocase subunit SecY [Cloacibacillus porcorum]|uniref:preprotein translocase subunit SecY n=1 Tax=Cloacibacillus porcorum TaxID=1197717 RepID=UPI00145952FE|nr:preprotein translocase subunit SecY [Cloacibacillus porcorum]MCC8184324.1 preprotein translocase subunit SecY [Cloacibacillus porcorum]MCD8233198.1 preprotein translocase subunit SecY [Cloacibacillus porcorum]MCI5864136.1 preprotein translocase subunit SecY [Cloacibacillus porcorum]MDD7648133.1 preprotein translocase subunit SecY [Cloacibacillus porcorum]MDY4092422.1 preprotein translocase subunit SecY [Cloacibacillus porcorum]
MLDSFRDTFRLPDLKRRILFTLAALFVYRLGAHVPTPGVDAAALGKLFDQGSLLGFLDLFAGGALSRFSIFALGVTPYINSSIVMQLLAVVVPSIEKMQKEGEEGRKKIVQWTRYGTIIFAFIQAVGMTGWLKGLGIYSGGMLDIILVSLTLTTGAVAVMWLGEIMSDHGIGNGISLLIFAGIVVRIPEAIIRTASLVRLGEMNVLVMLIAVAIMVAVVAGCVMLQEGQRRLPVQYAKRMVGNKMYGGQSSFIPLRVNTAGVIPIIFASSVLLFPYTIAGLFQHSIARMIQQAMSPSSPFYMVLYVLLIVFFSYFYTAVVFKPEDISTNMKKNGGFILGIRPGKPTTDYIEKVMGRITLGGSIALAVIAIIPTIMTGVMHINTFYFGGTAVIIVVGVALDTVHQIEGQLLMRHYEGILKRRGGKSGGLLKL